MESQSQSSSKWNSSSSNLPLLSVLGSPHCSLTSLELYLSGSRSDLEDYVTHFCATLKGNASIQHLNLIIYGTNSTNTEQSLSTTTSIGAGMHGWASLLQNSSNNNNNPQSNNIANHNKRATTMMGTIQDRLVNTLKHNYVLERIMVNHNLVELSDAAKMYLRLNRAGRRQLLETNNSTATAGGGVVVEDPASELDRWIETLGRVTEDISCVYYIVSCHPTLFCGQQDHHHHRNHYSAACCAVDQLPLKRKLCISPNRA